MKKIVLAVVAAVLAAAASEFTRRAIRRSSGGSAEAGEEMVDLRKLDEREAQDLVFEAEPTTVA